jgi:hypothetical protein
MKTRRFNKHDQKEAQEYLKELIQPGDTIYCILRHVSSSGMLRVIDLKMVKTRPDGQPDIYHIGYNAARAMLDTWDDDKEGIRIGGCGMDMGFALVYNLAYTLFGDGYKLESRWM